MTKHTNQDERLAGLKAVLFDFDGTLADTIPHILASFRHATEDILGAALTDEVLLQDVGIPLAHQMLVLSHGDPDVADRLLASYRTFNHATHDAMARPFPGAIEVLSTLREHGMPMGVVTSKGTPMAMKGLGLFGIAHYFAAIVTADDVPIHKPDPYPIVHAAGLLGFDVHDCAYVGDSPHDMEAARRAGAVAIAATWGVSTADALTQAGYDYMLSDIRELPGLLFGEASGSQAG